MSNSIKETLQAILDEASEKIEQSDALDKLNDVRVNFLGKKGQLTSVLKSMKDVAPEDRPKVGQMVNEARAKIETMMEETKTRLEKELREAKMAAEVIDVAASSCFTSALPSFCGFVRPESASSIPGTSMGAVSSSPASIETCCAVSAAGVCSGWPLSALKRKKPSTAKMIPISAGTRYFFMADDFPPSPSP